MNPKHKDRALVRSYSFSSNLLVCWAEIWSVSVYFKFDKILYIIDFRYDRSNDGKYKQVKATEVYLWWIKKLYQDIDDQYRKETVKQIL